MSSYKIILEVERYYNQRLCFIHCIHYPDQVAADLQGSAVEICRLISVDADALSAVQPSNASRMLRIQVDERAMFLNPGRSKTG